MFLIQMWVPLYLVHLRSAMSGDMRHQFGIKTKVGSTERNYQEGGHFRKDAGTREFPRNLHVAPQLRLLEIAYKKPELANPSDQAILQVEQVGN